MTRKSIGLIAAPFSPFNPDHSLNLEAVGPYSQWLCDQGAIGAFICGTTGESASMTVDERKRLAETWMDVAPPELRVIVHVGHVCLADACKLASHAEAIGADSIAALSPYFFKPVDEEAMVDWCQEIANAAPKTPFYYYHIPSMTGVNLRVSRFLELAADERIGNLAGVKFTHDDLDDLQACLQVSAGRFDILSGRDELLLPVLQLGVQGAVGSTYNFAAPLFRGIMAAHEMGDVNTAMGLQKIGTDVIDRLASAGGSPLANFKRFFSGFTGIDCGPVRLPLTEPTENQTLALYPKIRQSLLTAKLPSGLNA